MSSRHHAPHQPKYSAKNILKPVSFMYLGDAKSVFLIGDFNDWDPEAHPLTQHVDGAWRINVCLNHGHHHYQFLVDGKPTLDPRADGIGRNEKNEKVSLVAVS